MVREVVYVGGFTESFDHLFHRASFRKGNLPVARLQIGQPLGCSVVFWTFGCFSSSLFRILTPGSLRGGGAVHLYHQGVPIADLLWRLRLKQVTTLENYLQETAASTSTVFSSLPEAAKANVRSCSQMLPHFYTTIMRAR